MALTERVQVSFKVAPVDKERVDVLATTLGKEKSEVFSLAVRLLTRQTFPEIERVFERIRLKD